jgi:general secretion pathway protein G
MKNGPWSLVPGAWSVLGPAVPGPRRGLRTNDGPRTEDGPRTKDQEQRTAGYTFIELLVVSTMLLVLASAIMPLTRVTMQRMREVELRRSLREMRTAIDKFKDAADLGQIGATDLKAGAENYPPDLETLVNGVSAANDQTGRKLKFLRRVPTDPMTKSTDWGLRSYQDDPDSTRWGGQDVFDVHSKSEATALDGSKYKDW